VPEKLTVAWPCKSGQIEATSEQKTTTNSTLLFNITTPFGGPTPNDEATFR